MANHSNEDKMKAFCYFGDHKSALIDIPRPKILEPNDVVGKVLRTTICGSDLHLLTDSIPFCEVAAKAKPDRGFVLGHEGIIEVVEVGSNVKKFKVGDVAICSCITSCGHCYYCEHDIQAHCAETTKTATTACVLGIELDGFQSEAVRIPNADYSMYHIPEGIDLNAALMLCDVIPTSYELAVENKVKEGDIVAIIGLGPVGLAALLCVLPYKPSMVIAICTNETRLKVSGKMGAAHLINPKKEDTVKKVMELTAGLPNGKKPGVDLCIDAVGFPSTLIQCQDIVSPGGVIANVGVHLQPVPLKMEELWLKNISLTTGLVSTYSIPGLIEKVVKDQLDPTPLITHRFKLSEVEKAYACQRASRETGAVKIVVIPDGVTE